MIPEIRAVVVNFNGAHMLPECVRSLQAQQGVRVEVVIVDNGSRDDSRAAAARLGVSYRPLGSNRGLAVGYNEGARGASAPYLFFANNDMRFDPGCLAHLAGAFAARGDLFAADPRHLSWEGDRVTHGAQRLARDETSAFLALPGVRPYEDREAQTPVEIPWGCAGALLVDRARFETLGGFDASFFLYSEDVDLCLRAWLRGWATVHVPAALLYHRVSASHGEGAPRLDRLTRTRIRVSVPKNAQRVALKLLSARALAGQGRRLLRSWVEALGRGQARRVGAEVLALLWNFLELPAVLRDRRRERRAARREISEIAERFTGGSPG